MDSIDKLLAQLQDEYTGAKTQAQQQHQPIIKTANTFIASASKSDALIDNLLTEVQSDFLERDHAEELKKQQELEQEKNLQLKLKAQQRETLKKQAQTWLSKLDSLSPEGLWFERFAEAYPSKLDAAIEYLQNN
ncbi:salt stress protein, Slr1339 family [Anabaena sp. UHCC 0451]|uniref:salt stress protein, Slr1339 family n=1 Tax=Anabaena sp. UHCC 0451 TaxID=2055235 RepID=UPI002B21298A|nr:hypothetical protein [Anabaena sp. UHCC 0451]MEA5577159.1 hypothetical protein [Anabaena sp. UHCC 0451]